MLARHGPPSEFEQRSSPLVERLRKRSLSGAELIDAAHIFYYRGFAFVPTERPIALVFAAGGARPARAPAQARARVSQRWSTSSNTVPLRAGGCFRHSETIVVTDDGIEFQTDYARDFDSLTVDA